MNTARVAATAAFLLATTATAQTVAWKQRVYGPPASDEAPIAWLDYFPDTALANSRPLMAWSAAAVPGVVTAGSTPAGGLVTKLAAADGAELWRRALPDDVPAPIVDVAVDGTGDVVVAGMVRVPFNEYWRVAKLSGATGQVRWDYRPSWAAGEGVGAIAVDASGDVVVVGSRAGGDGIDAFITRLAATTGEPQWLTTLPRPAGAPKTLVATDAARHIVAVPFGATVVRLAPDGQPVWSTDLAQASALGDCARIRALRVDPASGDALVAGRRHCEPTFGGFVARLRAADGAVAWATTDFGDADNLDVATLATGTAGDVIVTGGRTLLPLSHRWFAARLSLADGDIEWIVPVADTSYGSAVDGARGSGGETLVAGACDGDAFCAARVDSRTGVRDWLFADGEPYSNDENYASAIVAAGGGVFVGGKDTADGVATWTVWRLDNAAGDAIFADGVEDIR